MAGHVKKDCPKSVAWRAKKDKIFTFVCSDVNFVYVPKDTWWCFYSHKYVYVGLPVEAVYQMMLED